MTQIPAKLISLAACTLVSGAALAPVAAPAAQICVPPPGLTGHWRGNDQGDYYIRQNGSEVWWVGMDSTTDGRGWTHAFRGGRSGNSIIGVWADVRGNSGAGSMRLTVTGMTMVRNSASGSGFGGTRWTKRC